MIGGSFSKFGKKGNNKFLDDYVSVEYVDESGHKRHKTKYVGPKIYFRERVEVVKKKLLVIFILSIFLVASLILMNCRTHATSFNMLVSMPTAVLLFPALTTFIGAFTLPLNGKTMNRDRYMHSMIRLFNSCGAIVPIILVIIVAELGVRYTTNDWLFLSGDYFFIISTVLSLLLAIADIVLLRSVDVDERELSGVVTNG